MEVLWWTTSLVDNGEDDEVEEVLEADVLTLLLPGEEGGESAKHLL